MPPLDDTKLEAFAGAMARGLSPSAAWRGAGYKGRSLGRRRELAERPDVERRVREIPEEIAWAGEPVLKAIHGELIGAVRAARRLGAVRGLMAARALLAEAARIRQKPPAAAPAGGQAKAMANAKAGAEPALAIPPPHPLLTTDEWFERFGPKARADARP